MEKEENVIKKMVENLPPRPQLFKKVFNRIVLVFAVIVLILFLSVIILLFRG